MSSPGGSFVRIIITGAARTGAAFGSVRRQLRQFVNDARAATRRSTNAFIANGGIPGLLRRQLAAARGMLGSFARAIPRVMGPLIKMGAAAGSAAAPFAALAGKIVLVIAALTTLIGIGGNIIGIIQLIAPAAIAGGAAMAVFKMALSGIGDAMKAGIEGDAEKLAEALKSLAPSAKSAVLTMLDLRREWKRTQRTVQEQFFKGFREDVIAVSRALQPIANKWLPKIADAFGMARHALRYVLTEAAKSGQLNTIMDGVYRFLSGLLNAVAPLARAFLDVAEVASGAFGDMGEGIAGAANKFADWIREMKNSGQLKEWLDKAIETVDKLWEAIKNVGKAIAGIAGASSEGGDQFLDDLVTWTKSLSDWVASGDGQEMIGIFSSLLATISNSAPMFKTILDVLGFFYGAFVALGTVGKAVWDGILDAAKFAIMWILDGYGLLVNGAAKAFSWIPGIGPKLKGAAADFNKFRDDVNNSLNGIQKTVDITVNYRARMIGNHLVSGAQQSGTYISGTGGRAHGGNATGVVMAGERGPELIDVGTGGARITNAKQTEAMLGGGGTGGNVNIYVAPARGAANDPTVNSLLDALNRGRLVLVVDRSGKVRPGR